MSQYTYPSQIVMARKKYSKSKRKSPIQQFLGLFSPVRFGLFLKSIFSNINKKKKRKGFKKSRGSIKAKSSKKSNTRGRGRAKSPKKRDYLGFLKVFLILVMLVSLGGVGVYFGEAFTSISFNPTPEIETNLIDIKASQGVSSTYFLRVEDEKVLEFRVLVNNVDNGELSVFEFNPDFYFETYTQQRDISIRNLPRFANNIKDSVLVDDMVLFELEKLVGIKINNYIIYEGVLGERSFLDFMSSNGLKSNFSNLEIQSKIDLLNSTQDIVTVPLSVAEVETLANGQDVNFIKSYKYTNFIQQKSQQVIPNLVRSEQAKVEIFNGSTKSGLAGQYRGYVQKSCCFVIRVDNAKDNVSKSKIYTSDLEKFGDTVNFLDDYFSEIDWDIVEGRPEFLTTGDVVMLIGSDLD